MRVRVAIGLAATLLLFASSGHAQGSNEAEARARYDEARKHYDLAEYDQAIEGFKEAYRLSEAPELLYNIAQAYRLKGLGNCRSALQFYKRYIAIEPKGGKRTAVQAAISDMEKCATSEPRNDPDAQPAATPAPPPAVAPPPPASDRPVAEPAARETPWIPIIVGGVGAAVGLTGGALVVSAKLDYDSIKSSRCAPQCDHGEVDAGRTRQTIGYVLVGVGGAAALTGLVLWLTSSGRDKRQAWIRPTGLVF